MLTKKLKLIIGPTMTFRPDDMRPLQAPYSDPMWISSSSHDSKNCNIRGMTCKPVEPNVGTPNQKQELTNSRGENGKSRKVKVNLLVIDATMAYNAQLGLPTLNTIKAIVASYLLLMQFELNDDKVERLYGDQKMVKECYYVNLKSLSEKNRTHQVQPSRLKKQRKNATTEALEVLFTMAEEHERRTCPKLTTPNNNSLP
ncbi:hypothetical protein Cgig2_030946 [Carnegiea gigantea]|uniref:Uncharacterized protein n=1 Tax=Carnegiea gigantea TaxID=171969 RepID=A0A9Q1JGE1_9CARY|nr:hypothetical protein Cgig2_030946 [Carnegiea gigantea]